jgi:adenosylcobyric acid synthase
MKALGGLGTSFSAGKSWMTTALCAWLRGLGVRVAPAAGFSAYQAYPHPWAEKRQAIYRAMARHVAAHVDLDPVRRYLGL